MSRYTVSQVIDAIRTHHGLLVLAADALGCSRTTIYSYLERYPAVVEALADERERLVDVAVRGLYHHLEEEAPWAIALVLKTLGRERGFGERSAPAPPRPHDADDVAEWEQIRSALLRALEPYEEARLAVVQALKALRPHESGNGHHPGA